MGPVPPVDPSLIRQAQPGFVDQGCRLECVSGAFVLASALAFKRHIVAIVVTAILMVFTASVDVYGLLVKLDWRYSPGVVLTVLAAIYLFLAIQERRRAIGSSEQNNAAED